MAEERIPLDLAGADAQAVAGQMQKHLNLRSGTYATPMTPFSPFEGGGGTSSPFARVDSMGVKGDTLPSVSYTLVLELLTATLCCQMCVHHCLLAPSCSMPCTCLQTHHQHGARSPPARRLDLTVLSEVLYVQSEVCFDGQGFSRHELVASPARFALSDVTMHVQTDHFVTLSLHSGPRQSRACPVELSFVPRDCKALLLARRPLQAAPMAFK